MYSWMITLVFICFLEVSGCVVVPAQGELSLAQYSVLQSRCIRLKPPLSIPGLRQFPCFPVLCFISCTPMLLQP